jgi:segregation and condensation protein A
LLSQKAVADFHVDLNMFRGPLDLLLYLVRKHEVDIVDIPVAPITEQYLEYLAVLKELNVDAVGDFLAMAGTLIELKSQQVLPRCDEVVDAVEDPRHELVRRLLEYKNYRDAAGMLEEQGRLWQQRYPRLSNDLPSLRHDPAEEPIQEVELWDLVSAFSRIMREANAARPANIVYDDTPIHVHIARVHARLLQAGRLLFQDLFDPTMHKSTLVAIFLAVLELVRHHHVRIEQNDLFGEIWIFPGSNAAAPLDLANVDEYEKTATAE